MGGYCIYTVMKADLFDPPLPNYLDRESESRNVGWVNPKLRPDKARLVSPSIAPRPPEWIEEKRRARKKEKRRRARARKLVD